MIPTLIKMMFPILTQNLKCTQILTTFTFSLPRHPPFAKKFPPVIDTPESAATSDNNTSFYTRIDAPQSPGKLRPLLQKIYKDFIILAFPLKIEFVTAGLPCSLTEQLLLTRLILSSISRLLSNNLVTGHIITKPYRIGLH